MTRAARRFAATPSRAGIAAACYMALALAEPAASRTVEYIEDMATLKAVAQDQGISGSLSDPPSAGGARIVLETPEAADHRVVIASIYCQAYHIDNPVSLLLKDLVATANRRPAEPANDPQPLTLRLLSGSTLLRCMARSDLQPICKNRVRIAARIGFTRAGGSPESMPIVAEVEREGRVGGFCANIARYTGVVTREAGIELVRLARAAAGRPAA